MAALLLGQNRVTECVGVAQRILEQDPCREDAHRLLMRCYALQGRAQAILHQHELCRRRLRTTLGCEPSAETTALMRDLTGRRSRTLAAKP